MKILFINASPRHKGVIDQMLSVMCQEAVARQAEVDELRLDRLQVHSCTGCMTCRQTGDCVLPMDDAQLALQHINAADCVVIGAPCYWGNMPGTLKILFDRMVYGLIGENRYGLPQPLHKGKKAIIVTSSTTSYPFNVWFGQTRGVVKALKKILCLSGFKILLTVEKGGTRQHHELTRRELSRCRTAIRRLVG